MPKQLELVDDTGLEIKPEQGRKEPRFWVRRLVIWKSPNEILREISLRPGLNILWSPDPADQIEATGDVNALGHGSGKTLFCRLLRYCLGEAHYASEGGRYCISTALPESMVGAEVMINGVQWAVIRSIGNKRQHYAVPSAGLEQVVDGTTEATGIEPFLEAVENTILKTEVVDLMPCNPLDAWRVALAWLSRDQECRFDKVLDWRSADSDSGSPARSLSASKLLDALRALVGAIEPAEIRTRGQIDELESQQKEANRDVSHRTWEAKRLRGRLLEELDLLDADIPTGRLGVEPLREAAKAKLAQLVVVRPGVDVSSLESLRAEADEAQQRIEGLRRDLAKLEGSIPEKEQMIRRIRGELPGSSAALFAAENPLCPVCDVPIDEVLAQGCKLSHKVPNRNEIKARHEQLKDELSSKEDRLSRDKSEQERLKAELAQEQANATGLFSSLRNAESARDARTESWYKTRRIIDDVARLDKLLVEEEKTQSSAEALSREIETKREQTSFFRDAQADVFNRLSRFFDQIIREIVGNNAKGRIILDGHGIKPSVELDGDRSTAAIASLKVIAFDLAVMCMSIEGGVPLPAFLIHDSPREADLGLSLYHRLLSCVHGLEHPGETPLFQYILTTTTRPPDLLMKKPWLADTLRGTPANERLLRHDL